MGSKFLVLAVFVLAAAAAGEALQGEAPAPERAATTTSAGRDPTARAPRTGFVLPRQGRLASDGRLTRKRVLRAGREFLSADAIERAFPGEAEGPIDVSEVAIAPDGTIVLAVYRFPYGEGVVCALELWRGRTPVGAFRVPPGSFGGGLAFDRTGELMALFSSDGALRGVYDRHGRRLEDFPDRFIGVG